MKQIVPKLIGLALMAGVASILLAVMAKLLAAAAFIALAAFYIRSRFKNRRGRMPNSFGKHRFADGYFDANRYPFQHQQSTAFAGPRQKMGIIPIN